jgi:predicted nucleic acid-binding protein
MPCFASANVEVIAFPVDVVQGQRTNFTHDAHLVAVMQVYSVAHILTFNTGHFKRFPGITVLDPLSI